MGALSAHTFVRVERANVKKPCIDPNPTYTRRDAKLPVVLVSSRSADSPIRRLVKKSFAAAVRHDSGSPGTKWAHAYKIHIFAGLCMGAWIRVCVRGFVLMCVCMCVCEHVRCVCTHVSMYV